MFNPNSNPFIRLTAIMTAGLMLVLVPVVQAEWFNRILTTISTSTGLGITFFLASPNNQTVVYLGDADINEQFELYSVPAIGGSINKLNGPLVTGGDVKSLTTLSGERLVYTADQIVDEQTELFSVPYAGGPATKLNGSLIAAGDVKGWAVSADATDVVYAADQDVDEVIELYHAPLTGGVITKLNGPLALGDSITSWALSSALEEVVYATQFSISSTTQITMYRVPVSGGGAITVTIPITSVGTFSLYGYSPTGERLLYYIGSYPSGYLYSVKLDGTDVQSLGNGNLFLPNMRFTPDGQKITYRAGDPLALYVVSIAGGLPTKLSADGGGSIIEWNISPDGSRAVYWAYLNGTGGNTGLYSVALTGGPVAPLHSAPVQIFNARHFQITPDSTQVVYVGESYRLYIASILGGTPTPLTGPMSADFWINSSDSAIIFTDDLDTANTIELYSLPLTGGTPNKLNRPLIANENVTGFYPTPNGLAVIYKVTGANYIELDIAYQPVQHIYLPLMVR